MSDDVIRVYGIKNCDTMKKAMTWLTDAGIDYEFHDYKKQGVEAEKVREWLQKVPPEELINRRGTTWRKLSDEQRNALNPETAVELIVSNTSLVKRPLLELKGEVYLGFKPESYQTLFEQH